ncbi:hypothetical protein ACW2AE_04580 [Limosilactobacillus fermentum]
MIQLSGSYSNGQTSADVEAEVETDQKLSAFPFRNLNGITYWLDQEINDCGIMLDQQLVTNAINCDQSFRQRYLDEAHDLLLPDWMTPNSAYTVKGVAFSGQSVAYSITS